MESRKSYCTKFFNKEGEIFGNDNKVWKFSDFQIHNKMETGSTSIVLKATEKDTNKVYALKKIAVYNSNYTYKNILKIIENEINVGKSNISDCTIPIYGWFKYNKRDDTDIMFEEYYIVCKYCDSDLFNFRTNLPLHFKFMNLLKIIKQMVKSFSDLHLNERFSDSYRLFNKFFY